MLSDNGLLPPWLQGLVDSAFSKPALESRFVDPAGVADDVLVLVTVSIAIVETVAAASVTVIVVVVS